MEALQSVGLQLFLVLVITVFRPFSELWPRKWYTWISACTVLVFLGWQARTVSLSTIFQLIQEKHFPLGERKPAGWCDGRLWCGMLGKQSSGMLLRISSVRVRTSQSRALSFRTTHTPLQPALGAGVRHWPSNVSETAKGCHEGARSAFAIDLQCW